MPFGGRLRTDEELQDLADAPFPDGRVGQRQVGADLVVVPAPLLLLDDIASVGEVGDDGVRAALGDTQRRGDVTQAHAWVVCNAQERRGVIGQEAPLGHT